MLQQHASGIVLQDVVVAHPKLDDWDWISLSTRRRSVSVESEVSEELSELVYSFSFQQLILKAVHELIGKHNHTVGPPYAVCLISLILLRIL